MATVIGKVPLRHADDLPRWYMIVKKNEGDPSQAPTYRHRTPCPKKDTESARPFHSGTTRGLAKADRVTSNRCGSEGP